MCIRDRFGVSGTDEGALTVVYTTWNDWVGNWMQTNEDFEGTPWSDNIPTGATITMVVTIGGAEATFSGTMWNENNGVFNFRLDTLVASSGTPARVEGQTAIFTGSYEALTPTITFNTNHQGNLLQSITIVSNDGVNTAPSLTTVDGVSPTGTSTTYLVTDPFGTEYIAFTSSCLLYTSPSPRDS